MNLEKLAAIAAALALILLVSCGDITVGPNSSSVGAACTVDGDCVKRCLVDGRHFPGGLCTLPCAGNADCPAGSVCVAEQGGTCVVSCRTSADCAAFGRGFACDSES